MIVSEADARSDWRYFEAHRSRRFRSRFGDGGRWFIRFRPSVNEPEIFLRVAAHPSAPLPADNDPAIGAAWFASAFPDWSRDQVTAAVQRALKRGPTR
jgi:hypothetical protein